MSKDLLNPEWETLTHCSKSLAVDFKEGNVKACEIRTQNCLAEVEIGPWAKRFHGHKPTTKWTHHWHVEFHPVSGWDMRYSAMGSAKSFKHAQQLALTTVMNFIEQTVKPPKKTTKRLIAENAALAAERNLYRRNSGLLRYVIKTDMPDSAFKKKLLDYARVSRIG